MNSSSNKKGVIAFYTLAMPHMSSQELLSFIGESDSDISNELSNMARNILKSRLDLLDDSEVPWEDLESVLCTGDALLLSLIQTGELCSCPDADKSKLCEAIDPEMVSNDEVLPNAGWTIDEVLRREQGLTEVELIVAGKEAVHKDCEPA